MTTMVGVTGLLEIISRHNILIRELRSCFYSFLHDVDKIIIEPLPELCDLGEQTIKSQLFTNISKAKSSCSKTIDILDLLEKFLYSPSEENAEPLKRLFEHRKSTGGEHLMREDVDKTSEKIGAIFDKKRSAEVKKTQHSDQTTNNCENTNLKYDSDSQPSSSSEEVSTLDIKRKKTLNTLDGASQHSHKNKQDDDERKTSGKIQHEVKQERDKFDIAYRYLQILRTKMEDMEGENSSLKEQLKLLQTEHMETLSELGQMMVERTAKENKKRESEQALGIKHFSIAARKNGSITVFQNPNQSISGGIAQSKKQAVQGAEALVETNHYEKRKGEEKKVANDKDARKLREEESQRLYKSTSNCSEKEKKGDGKYNNKSEKKEEEKSSSDCASTFAGESKNEDSMRQSSEELSFTVQQDSQNDRDSLSLSNQPLTLVATTLYNSYKLLFLTLAERLLTSDAEQLKNWASQRLSIEPSQEVTDVLFQLDHKEIINVSDLSPLKDFFESIVRFDLVHIIDAFLLGDYDVLRYNPRKLEVDANTEQRPRQRARSDYTSNLSGVSAHSASLSNGAEGYPEDSRRSENNDEVQTLIPHLPRQTPFKTFPTHQHSTYEDENPSSAKYGQPTFGPNSTRFTAAVVVADGPVKRESRLRSSNSSASANSTLNQKRSTQTVGSNGFKLSKPRLPDTVQSNSRSPRNQAPDDDQEFEGNWLCNHYKRRCFVKFECCDKFWPCHRCHNNQSTCGRKKLKSRDTKKLKCASCNKVQEFGQYCRNCNVKFAKYYCGLCKHLTGTDDHPYHCDKCGICRILGNRSFHCDICGVCLDVQLRGNHKCREGSAPDECCICLELGQCCRCCNDDQRIVSNKDKPFPTSSNHLDRVTFTILQTSEPERNAVLENEGSNSRNTVPLDVTHHEVLPDGTSSPISNTADNVRVLQRTRFSDENRALETARDEDGQNNVGSVRTCTSGNPHLEQVEGDGHFEEPVPSEPPEICYLYTFNNHPVRQETQTQLDQQLIDDNVQRGEAGPLERDEENSAEEQNPSCPVLLDDYYTL